MNANVTNVAIDFDKSRVCGVGLGPRFRMGTRARGFARLEAWG